MKKQILAPSILALFVASAAHAGATFDTAAGSLYLGGDVEWNYDSYTGNNLEAGGRLLVDINGSRTIDSGAFAAFKVNPTFGYQGGTGVDDAWLQFGMQDNWNIKAGHFEATNLSVPGMDIYVLSAGTTTYRANDARGRVGTDGEAQATFTKSMGDAAFELTVNTGDEGNNGDTVILRPVVTYGTDMVSLAVGAELPVVDSTETYEWTGYGATATVTVSDSVYVNLRAAFKSGDDIEDQMTAGFGVGIDNFYAHALYVDDGVTDETDVFAAYKIPSVLGIDNFTVFLGAAMAMAEDSDDDVVGGRLRLKYIF